MSSIWAGRWGRYHRIKKKIYEWDKEGISLGEIKKRIQTITDNKPVKLEIVKN